MTRLAWKLPIVWVQLRLFGFKKTYSFTTTETTTSRASQIPLVATPLDYAQRCARLTEIAASHGLYKANCLHQSLALCSFLRQRGLHARMRIGVLPTSKPFDAHAWVELEGTPLGQAITEYQPFPGLT
jgi:transglutaminase-like putative cysteine protease